MQQLRHPPDQALRDDYSNYSYVPFGETLFRHYQDFASEVVGSLHLGKESFVVDIGSNNGLLLKQVQTLSGGCTILGVEPALDISKGARKDGIPTLTAFFTEEVADHILLKYGKADAVLCTQTLQHIPTPGEFAAQVKRLLKVPSGTFVYEGRNFTSTLEKRSYDTIYPEMISFFTLHSLVKLLETRLLHAFLAKVNEAYGGSLRVYARTTPAKSETMLSLALKEESDVGVTSTAVYRKFATDVNRLRIELREKILSLRSQGMKVAGYGAPSTGTTLLNYCSFDRHDIVYLVDDSPLKQGLYQPGTRIPIVSSDVLGKEMPDVLLIVAWRLKDEILQKVEPLRRKGMRVLIPLPTMKLL